MPSRRRGILQEIKIKYRSPVVKVALAQSRIRPPPAGTALGTSLRHGVMIIMWVESVADSFLLHCKIFRQAKFVLKPTLLNSYSTRWIITAISKTHTINNSWTWVDTKLKQLGISFIRKEELPSLMPIKRKHCHHLQLCDPSKKNFFSRKSNPNLTWYAKLSCFTCTNPCQ